METTHETTATVVGSLTYDFLDWLARTPRTYEETMDAWRSSCPRFTIWENALADGFVRVERRNGMPRSQAAIVLTARGRAILDGSR